MLRPIIFILTLFVTAFATFAQTPAKWVEYTSPDGLYSILLPTAPDLKKQDAKGADGKPVDQYLASAQDGNIMMMVGYFDYSNTFSFEKARDGMVANVKGKLVSEEAVKLGNYPGRNAVVEASASGFAFRVYVRFYDAGGRVYVIQYIVPMDEDGPSLKPKMAKYFDSFKITRK